MATETVEALESRSISEERVPVAPPVPSPEQKNNILILQRQILSLQVNIHNAQKQLEQLGPALSDTLNKLATDGKVDTNKWAFNLDTLNWVPKV